MLQGHNGSSASKRIRNSRTHRVGLTALSLALVTAGTVSNTVAVGAQEPTTTTTTTSAIAPYDPAKFFTGEATSSGQTFRFNIKQGNADIGLSYGSVYADYRDRTGKADSRALDLGVFPTLFGVPQCDGSPPILNPATFPPKTVADSGVAGSEVPHPADAFMPGFGQDPHGDKVGTQVATATKQPSSASSTVSEDADMFFISIIGGKSEATASLKNNVREAHAVVTARELRVMGGLFTFENPRWEATAKSGAVTDVSGSFTFTRATVLGFPRTAEDAMADLAEFKYNLEQLLGPLGAKLELPKVVVNDNKVEVTPMTFSLVDPPFGKELIRPFLRDIEPMRQAWVDQQLNEDCKNETNLMLGDIVLGILSGSGAVQIHAGGVDATTDDTDFTVPPVQPIGETSMVPAIAPTPSTPDIPPETYETVTAGEWVPGTSGYSGTSGYDSSSFSDTSLPGSTAAPPTKANAPVGVKDKSTERKIQDAADLKQTKAGTAAVGVGVAGLLGAIGLAISERLRERRTRRRIP